MERTLIRGVLRRVKRGGFIAVSRYIGFPPNRRRCMSNEV